VADNGHIGIHASPTRTGQTVEDSPVCLPPIANQHTPLWDDLCHIGMGRITSPERSTPGLFPYNRPNTPSYLPSRAALPATAQRAVRRQRSSFRPGSNTTLCAVSDLAARHLQVTAPKGDRGYPVTSPRVFRTCGFVPLRPASSHAHQRLVVRKQHLAIFSRSLPVVS